MSSWYKRRGPVRWYCNPETLELEWWQIQLYWGSWLFLILTWRPEKMYYSCMLLGKVHCYGKWGMANLCEPRFHWWNKTAGSAQHAECARRARPRSDEGKVTGKQTLL